MNLLLLKSFLVYSKLTILFFNMNNNMHYRKHNSDILVEDLDQIRITFAALKKQLIFK